MAMGEDLVHLEGGLEILVGTEECGVNLTGSGGLLEPLPPSWYEIPTAKIRGQG